jgi:phage FluMu protein Com
VRNIETIDYLESDCPRCNMYNKLDFPNDFSLFHKGIEETDENSYITAHMPECGHSITFAKVYIDSDESKITEENTFMLIPRIKLLKHENEDYQQLFRMFGDTEYLDEVNKNNELMNYRWEEYLDELSSDEFEQ